MSRRQCADIFWTGGLSSGHNRWFDKSIQIMCTKNGKAGLIGEHSMVCQDAYANHIHDVFSFNQICVTHIFMCPLLPLSVTKMDGMPMVDFSNYITKHDYVDVKTKSIGKAVDGNLSGGVENIFGKCIDTMIYGDSKVESMVEKGKTLCYRNNCFVMKMRYCFSNPPFLYLIASID